jgi:hypothetical protein
MRQHKSRWASSVALDPRRARRALSYRPFAVVACGVLGQVAVAWIGFTHGCARLAQWGSAGLTLDIAGLEHGIGKLTLPINLLLINNVAARVVACPRRSRCPVMPLAG